MICMYYVINNNVLQKGTDGGRSAVPDPLPPPRRQRNSGEVQETSHPSTAAGEK